MKIDITNNALDKLKEVINKKNSEVKDVRVYIAGVG